MGMPKVEVGDWVRVYGSPELVAAVLSDGRVTLEGGKARIDTTTIKEIRRADGTVWLAPPTNCGDFKMRKKPTATEWGGPNWVSTCATCGKCRLEHAG